MYELREEVLYETNTCHNSFSLAYKTVHVFVFFLVESLTLILVFQKTVHDDDDDHVPLTRKENCTTVCVVIIL